MRKVHWSYDASKLASPRYANHVHPTFDSGGNAPIQTGAANSKQRSNLVCSLEADQGSIPEGRKQRLTHLDPLRVRFTAWCMAREQRQRMIKGLPRRLVTRAAVTQNPLGVGHITAYDFSPSSDLNYNINGVRGRKDEGCVRWLLLFDGVFF